MVMDFLDYYGIVLYELRCIAGPCLKVLDDYTSVDVWRVLRKDLSFVVFVMRSFFLIDQSCLVEMNCLAC